MTAPPSARGWRSGAPRPSFPPGGGRTNPHDPEQCPARNAAERGLSWLKGWWRVATRYDPYAHRFLDFLYLAAAWIWLQSYLNRT